MKTLGSQLRLRALLMTGILLLAAAVATLPVSGQAAAQKLTGPALIKKLTKTLPKVVQYDYGMSREPLTLVADLLLQAQSDPGTAREAEKQLLASLQSRPTNSGRDFLCRQLSLIGTDQSVPVLESMLVSPDTSNVARYALERIPGPAANGALRKHLSDAAEAEKIGLINSLGNRRDAEALPALEGLAKSSSPAVAIAAVSALGKIAGMTSLTILDRIRTSASGAVQQAALDAYLLCIDSLLKEGKKSQAADQYRLLTVPGQPVAARLAALRGYAAADPGQAVALLTANLEKEEAAIQAESIRLLAAIPEADPTQRLLQSYPGLPSRQKAVVLTMLSGSKDAAVREKMTAALKDESADVRMAAMSGLIQSGDAACVRPLAEIAARTSNEEQVAARQSLARLRNPEVNSAISNAIAGAEPKVKVELLRAMGERGAEGAVHNVLQLAKEGESQVRREALRVARDLAGPAEFPELLSLLVSSQTSTLRTETERALSGILRRYPDVKIDTLLAALKQQSDPEIRASLITVLADTNNAAAMGVLKEALKDSNAEVKRAAILGLSTWNDPALPAEMLAVARQANVPAHKVLALRGLVNTMGRTASKRKPAESVKMLNQALALASQPEEKKTLIGALPRYASKDALKTAQSQLKDKSVAEEAQLAVNSIKQQLAQKKKK